MTSILARVLYLATGGAFSLVVCLLSFGMLTDDSGIGVHKELTLSQQCAGAQPAVQEFGPFEDGTGQVEKNCVLLLPKQGPRPEL